MATKKKAPVKRKKKPTVEDAPKLSVEDEDGNLKTPAELVDVFKEAGTELRDKAKEVGLQPLRDAAVLLVSGGLSLLGAGLEALEGKKKKKKK